MNDFLPQDYKVPSKADGYMKFQQGDNRFRIITSPIIGWEWWEDTTEGGRRPNRVHKLDEVPSAEKTEAKHFWAMIVWNYDAKQFQILEITQKGIQKTIKNLSQDEDWGTPLGYDLVVTKTGEKLDTEYETKPKPAKPLEEEIAAKTKDLNIELNALYEGKDPFSTNESLGEDITEEDLKNSGLTDVL